MHLTTRLGRAAVVLSTVLPGALAALAACGGADAETPQTIDAVPEPARPRDTHVNGAEAGTGAGTELGDAGSPFSDDAGIIGTPLPAAPACALDTRSVYIEGARKLESITAYGRYWSREVKPDGSANEGGGFPHAVLDEDKFAKGPCAGRAPCVLDSRVIHFEGNEKLESTTAYGRSFLWSFGADGSPKAKPGFPQVLTVAPALANGPCAGKGDACKLDTRSIELVGGVKVETITAYGRLHRFSVIGEARTPLAPTDVTLETVTRYAAGPCRGQPVAACTFDTQTIYVDSDGVKSEEITAQGRLWVFRFAANDSVITTTVDGATLVDIPRFAGPCKPE